MNIEKKFFNGRLNSDINERLFATEKFFGDYIDAYNVLVFSAIDSGIGLVKGFKGTTEIAYNYGYTSSARKVIGREVDFQNKMVYFIIAHASTPNANDGIYRLNVLTKEVELVIKGAFLKLNNAMRITGIDVVDGKYLLYTDGVNTPRNIDIQRAIDGELTTEMQIAAIKPAPTRAPHSLTNVTDPTFNDNNIRGNFFQFKYRWVYKDNTKSTFSPISKISQMGNLFMPEVEQVEDYQTSNAIQFKYNIPNEDVVAVEIASRSGNTGDFGLVDTIQTAPEKVFRSDVVYFRNYSIGGGVGVYISIDGGSLIGTISYAFTVEEVIEEIYNYFIAAGVGGDITISYDTSLRYISFVSKVAGVDFEITTSSSDLAQVVNIVNLPVVGDNVYLFKNNNLLLPLDIRESNLEYDRVPIKALAQKVVNGSNVVYGGITEGFDTGLIDVSGRAFVELLDSNEITAVASASESATFSIDSPTSGITIASDFNLNFNDGTSTTITVPAGSYTRLSLIQTIYDLFLVANNDLKIYLNINPTTISYSVKILSIQNNTVSSSSGNAVVVATSPISGTDIEYTAPVGALAENTYLSVKITKGSAYYFYSYTTIAGDTLSSALINLCSIISTNDNDIVAYVHDTDSDRIKIYATNTSLSAISSLIISPLASKISLKDGDSYSVGVVYSDEYGRLSTVVTNEACKIDTSTNSIDSLQYIKPIMTISSRPPAWAKYWHMVITKRRKTGFFLRFEITTIGADGDKMRFYINGSRSNLPFYNETFGAKLSYEFAEGDRVKFIRYKNGTVLDPIEDLPILSVAEDGALETSFLKNTELDYSALEGCIVEVYRPNSFTEVSEENSLFYETGLSGYVENFGLSTRYHEVYAEDLISGEAQPQTSNLSSPLICRPNTGDVWVKPTRLINFTKDGSGVPNSWSVGDVTYYPSMYQSDRYPVETADRGRANAYDRDAKQVFRKATMYFSESYFVDSSVNNINRIYANSFKDYDQTYGAIKLLHLDGFLLYSFQENRVGAIPVNKQMVFNQDGSSSLILSSELLNQCKYFDYMGGINDNPESFCYNQFNKYFVDILNNAVCKIGGNGIIRISDISMTSHFTSVFNNYKQADLTLTSGQTPRFYGAWDEDNKLVIFAPETLVQSNGEDDPILYQADTIAYSENQGGWSTKMDFKPSAIIGCLGELISWSPANGKIWEHNSNETRNLFYGSQKTRSVTFAMASAPSMNKSYLTFTQEAEMVDGERYSGIYSGSDPSVWNVPEISTSFTQESNLLSTDFSKKEGMYYAKFWRDTTTPVANPLINGDQLKGSWIKCKITNDSTDDVGLYSIGIGSVPSKRSGY